MVGTGGGNAGCAEPRVAQRLDLLDAVPGGQVVAHPEQPVEVPRERLGRQPLAQRREAHHVGEHDGDVVLAVCVDHYMPRSRQGRAQGRRIDPGERDEPNGERRLRRRAAFAKVGEVLPPREQQVEGLRRHQVRGDEIAYRRRALMDRARDRHRAQTLDGDVAAFGHKVRSLALHKDESEIGVELRVVDHELTVSPRNVQSTFDPHASHATADTMIRGWPLRRLRATCLPSVRKRGGCDVAVAPAPPHTPPPP